MKIGSIQGVKILQDQVGNILQGVKLMIYHQDVKLHHNLQGAKHPLQDMRRPNIIVDKRCQATRIFIDIHPLMIFVINMRIQDVILGILAMEMTSPR